MSDNFAFTPGVGGTGAAKDIGGNVLAQRVQPIWGGAGVGDDVSAADPLPTSPMPQGTTTGSTASRVNAAAGTNAASLKSSGGNIYGIHVFNVAVYDVFLKLYNKASAPTVGTDTPAWTIPIKAGSGFSANFPLGTPFPTGIAYAITKFQPDADTTPLVAGDVTGRITWM